jgi:methylmalonyl-CoA/ethylmalonyl-CoA epimerase
VRLHDCIAAAAQAGAWHDPGVSALGIHHVGIAVRDLDEAGGRYERLLGAVVEAHERVEEQGVEALCLLLGDEGRVELLAPLAEDTPVGRFLTRRGEGMHHLAFGVADVAAELERLRAAGATLIDDEPRTGVYGAMAFVHHESLGGVLSELIQSTKLTEA